MSRRPQANLNLCPTVHLFVALTLTLTASALAVRPYEPNVGDPLQESWRWQHIEELDGLSFQYMTQDTNGIMWFGLRNGILCYDGLHWQHFHRREGLTWQVQSILTTSDGRLYALTHGNIHQFVDDQWRILLGIGYGNDYVPGQALAEDSSGTVWAASRQGLVRIQGQKAELYQSVAGGVTTIFVDSADNLWWLGADCREFQVVPLQQGQFGPAVQHLSFPLYTKNGKRKACLAQTREGRIWIGSDIRGDPLHTYDPQTGTWTHEGPESIGSRFACTSILETQDRTLWIAGLGTLWAFKDGHWKVYNSQQVTIPSWRAALLEAADGALWIGEVNARMYRVDYSDRQYLTYHGLHFQCENAADRRWFLTETGTIVAQEMGRDIWKEYDQRDNLIDAPVVIIATRDGSVWAAGSHASAAAVSRFDGERWDRRVFAELGFGISHCSAFETAGGDVVFGCSAVRQWDQKCKGGILLFRRTDQGYEVEHIPEPHVPFRVVGIAETAEGLWSGGPHLNCFDGRTSRNMEMSLDLPPGWIDHLLSTRNGQRLWVAKGGEGLFEYDGHIQTQHGVKNGLASNMISYLCEHPDGTILAATSSGISRFDGELWQTLTMPETFRMDREGGSMYVTATGEIWINRTERAWYFRAIADKVELEPIDSPFLTSRYRPDSHPPDTTITPLVDSAAMAASITIHWAGLDAWSTGRQEQLHYSYRLDDRRWSPFYRRTNHTLVDLTPGRHIFEVRARDRAFNVEPQPARITFTVTAPVWRQPWFILLIGTLSTAILVLTVYLVRSHMARVTQQLQLEKQEAQHKLAIDESRLAFFTNISHELRTPLTLILGPLEALLSKSKPTEKEFRTKTSLAKRSADRLLQLVNQLLDMRKLQEGKLQFSPTEDDIIRFAGQIVESMQPGAEPKKMMLEFRPSVPQLAASFDPDKLEKILVNLISNAIKFTPERGRIIVTVATSNDQIELSVEDTGAGIPPDQQDHVFERFYRTADSGAKPGSGIGLSLARELVHLHSGTISVASPVNPGSIEDPGTRITVQLPREVSSGQPPSPPAPAEPVESLQPVIADNDNAQKPSVLLVEDNEDMRLFVSSVLVEDYRLVEAKDGQEALALTREVWPDLIVSDIMMPTMDGLELCRALKTDENTSHIPIILLTAKGSEEAQVVGLETGADDYVSKPFSSAILLARIANLLESRRLLRKRFRRSTILDPKEFAVTSADEQFLQRAMDVMAESMSDCEFDVNAFAEMMSLSRSSLYRKFKALAGQSPSFFIRSTRLKRAAILLESGQLSVSEIAYRVGFWDATYFSTCFKDHFQCTPSQYSSEHRAKHETS